MRLAYRVVCIVIVLQLHSNSALGDDLSICNLTPYGLHVALAYQSGDINHREGWYLAEAGECIYPGTTYPLSETFYFFAQVKDGDVIAQIVGHQHSTWGGETKICAPNKAFLLSGSEIECRTEDLKTFRKKNGKHLSLTHSSYDVDSTDEAKMLRAAILSKSTFAGSGGSNPLIYVQPAPVAPGKGPDATGSGEGCGVTSTCPDPTALGPYPDYRLPPQILFPYDSLGRGFGGGLGGDFGDGGIGGAGGM